MNRTPIQFEEKKLLGDKRTNPSLTITPPQTAGLLVNNTNPLKVGCGASGCNRTDTKEVILNRLGQAKIDGKTETVRVRGVVRIVPLCVQHRKDALIFNVDVGRQKYVWDGC